MQAREDYKAGWQIERDWNEEMKQKRLKAEAAMKKMFAGEDEDSDDEQDQGSDDKNPVSTKCFSEDVFGSLLD
jgi:RING finger protein 113A